jgi:molecular chaperone DnaK
MGRVIGIDLGAMYAKVAYREKEAFHLIENQEGEVLTPSAVYFDENGMVCVGAGAKYEAAHCPEDLVECFVKHPKKCLLKCI